MKRNKIALLVYVIIAFAAIGLVSQLFGNTVNFLMSILIMLGVAVAIFALLNFFINRNRGSSDDMKKYKQAVKQSKMKYQKQQPTGKNKTQPRVKQSAMTSGRKSKKRASHLRVIEGNKSKDKDRASF